MAQAKIESVEALRDFKATLWKFAESANVALSDAESELRRVLNWLETEAEQYWRGQVRKREDNVRACKEALRQKEVFKDSAGMKQSVIDEQKRLAKAIKALEEAEQKHANVGKHRRILQREILTYKGQTQRFATAVQHDLPKAVDGLERIMRLVATYTAIGAAVDANSAEGRLVAYDFVRPIGDVQGAGSMAQLSWQKIVERTPSDEARRGATHLPGSAFLQFNQSSPISLPEFEYERTPPDFDRAIVVADRSLGANECFLRRLDPLDTNDSGWYIGPCEGDPPQTHVSLRIGDVLELRPEMRDILSLPLGWSLLVGNGRVTRVYDGKGELQYPMMELPPAE